MDRILKILHLEDNDYDAELFISQLESEKLRFEVTRVLRKQEFINAIENQKFDLILSDNTLPDFDGIDALRYAKKIQPDTPFVFLSGTLNEDVAIEAMRWGASDYVLKQRLNKLGITVKRVIQEFDRKRELELASDRIKESEEKYRTLVETSPDVIVLVDVKGKIIFINSSISILLGFQKEELIGKNIFEQIVPEDQNKAKENFINVISGVQIKDLELILLKKNGGTVTVDVRVALLKDTKNNPTSVSVLVHDISVRKNAELEIKKAKEKAEELNNLKSYFLANMSHELRTPMVPILGFAELLKTELKNPEHIELVDSIIDGGIRLNSTLNNILELSKIEATHSALNLSVCNITEEIEEKVESLKDLAKKKNLFLRTEIHNRSITAEIDPDLFGCALLHILDNGLKFTENGGVVVQVGTQKLNEQYKIVIKIIDTGIGISSSDIKKIFYDFRQVSEGFNRSHEGAGIGLTVARKIIELLNGEIWVESELGKGSAFYITLPLKLSESQITHEVSERRKTTIIEEPSARKAKPSILLVEDNSQNREIAKLFLKHKYEVIEAVDGITALAIASKVKFDLVLMDINLGKGLDGITTMQRLRSHPDYKDIPILAVTAYVMCKDREKLLGLGFDGYIPKPFTKEILVDAIKQKLYTSK